MESINKVELRGNIGNVYPISSSGESRSVRFSLATNTVLSRSNTVETTWHSIIAWDSVKGLESLEQIVKGAPVTVWGRIHIRKYRSKDGEEKESYEIVAKRIELYDDSEE